MRSSFPRTFLFMLAGPIIWAAHFLFIYSAHGLVCARPGLQVEWLNLPAVAWVIVLASMLALAAMMAAYLRGRRLLEGADTRFVLWIAAALSLISALAIAWETIPLAWIPACG